MHGIVLTAAYSNFFYCRRAWEHLQFPVEDTNGEEDSEELTATDVKQLERLLKDEQLDSLALMIRRLVQESRKRSAPDQYRLFLSELSRSSPVCGMLQVYKNFLAYHFTMLSCYPQVAGNDDVIQVIMQSCTVHSS